MDAETTAKSEMVMISIEIFETIKQKYGDVASWAVWEDVGAKPKSNMGHLNIFDLQKNPTLLEVLKKQCCNDWAKFF